MPPRQGAFAEYLRIPERNLIELPGDMDPAIAALSEPVATAWHAVAVGERHSWRTPETTRALVLGGGAVGLSAALVLRSRGYREICVAETNPLRRETAAWEKELTIIDPAVEPVEENGFDLVVDAVGGATEILVDGGIRRGTDVLKALALGAQAVLIGKSYLWALAVDGEAGVRNVLDILRWELSSSMALAGRPNIASIEGDLIARI